MNFSRNNILEISNVIAFDGRIKAALRRHTAVICWTHGESPVFGVKDNGTCCFIQTSQKRFILTCSHIWRGFEKEKSKLPLWVSLIFNDHPNAPSFPLLLKNPTLIDEDDRLDLATITFDEIDKLESWRFHYLIRPNKYRVLKGGPACFICYTGDGLRAGESQQILNYTLFTISVSDTAHTKFLMHEEKNSSHTIDQHGDEIGPVKMGGASGSPVFSFLDSELWLAGVVCEVSSPGLLGGKICQGYEMSNGDIYASYAKFVQSDGTIRVN